MFVFNLFVIVSNVLNQTGHATAFGITPIVVLKSEEDLDDFEIRDYITEHFEGNELLVVGDEDLVMITADHGCDPAYTVTTDHTREYVPLLIMGKKVKSVNLGTRTGFQNIAATIADVLNVDYTTDGESFAAEIL